MKSPARIKVGRVSDPPWSPSRGDQDQGRSETCPTRGGIKKKLLVGLFLFAVIGAMAWVFALPAIVRSRVTAHTGCPVEAGAIRANPLTGTMRLVDFRLRNPAGFPVPEFVDLTLLDVDVDVLSLVGDEIRVARAVIDVPRVTIVTGQDGVTNTGAVRQHVDAANKATPASRESEPAQKFRIDELEIRLGTIELVDYSRGSEPVRRTIALNADHRFTDVTDARVVIRPLLADLARANAGGLLNTFGGLLPGPFRDALGGALDGALDGAGGAVKKLIDSLPVGR